MPYFYQSFFALLLLIGCSLSAIGQVGIGTLAPDPSALIDISSTTQGMLAPRMSTVERLAIDTPANGLIVFDKDLNSYQYYSASSASWVEFSGRSRDNFVLVKSQADFPAPNGGIITLDSKTYYEINGTVNLTASIDLNNAYVSGIDPRDDVLSYPGGTIFKGATGGSIRDVTLTGGKAFEIAGSGAGNNMLLLQNSIVAGMTTSVGSISNVDVFFSNIVQYINNANGTTYSDIGNLLLNNQAWFASNSGTYETLTGNFGLVQKASGFSIVTGAAVAFDVSANPELFSGVILSRNFSGDGTYVKGYTKGSYDGFNFSKVWNVNCPGLPRESDDVAAGNFYFSGNLTSGFTQTISNDNSVKITGNANSPNKTTANSLFRFRADGNNKLVYDGTKKRDFQINASLSVRGGTSGDFFAFLIAKNGTIITESNSVVRIENSSNIQNVSLNSIVTMEANDYIEIYTRRLVGSNNSTLSIFSENLSIK